MIANNIFGKNNQNEIQNSSKTSKRASKNDPLYLNDFQIARLLELEMAILNNINNGQFFILGTDKLM
jgi:hypothetical protein